MKRTLITALLIVFTFLGILSALFMYSTHTIALEEKLVTPLYTYTNRGTFDYLVNLKPNTVYDNKTTLRAGEGAIYRRITDLIEVNFTYTFDGSDPANLTIQYNVTAYVETPKWMKRVGELPVETLNTNGTEATFSINDLSPINASSVEDLVKAMRSDTGIPISDYSVNIKVEMHIEAETSEGFINETFSPTLILEFQSSMEEGDIVLVSGLVNSDSGEITKTETIYHSWVESQRYISYAFSAVAFSGLIVTAWMFLRTRPHKILEPEKVLEDFISPYEEIIVETTQEPNVRKPQLAPTSIVAVETLEDIVKIAEISGKPILHIYQPPEDHTFYVFDGTIQFEFTITLSTLVERKTTIEREEDEWDENQN